MNECRRRIGGIVPFKSPLGYVAVTEDTSDVDESILTLSSKVPCQSNSRRLNKFQHRISDSFNPPIRNHSLTFVDLLTSLEKPELSEPPRLLLVSQKSDVDAALGLTRSTMTTAMVSRFGRGQQVQQAG
jgi:hypothetical protein